MKIKSFPYNKFVEALQDKLSAPKELKGAKKALKKGFSDPHASMTPQEAGLIDYSMLKKMHICNIRSTANNGVRGETLSGKKNRKLLAQIKEAGVKNIIDLRGDDASLEYAALCKKNNLGYYRFPIDFDKISNREIIDNLPEFFDVINKGNYYIACAQGLHRTDVAMALNYFFNPKAPLNPPIMYGHTSAKGFNPEKIFRRTNGVFKNLTPRDKVQLGLSREYDEAAYLLKKKRLVELNKRYAQRLFEAQKA